jgi:hypothetical protein
MAINNSLDNFKSNFHGGTRRNRFEISGSITGGGALTTYHAYAFTLPQVGIGEIPVDYRGRRLYIPGDRDYPQWTLTILDDNNGAGSEIYHGFQAWQKQINDHVANTSSTNADAGRQRWVIKQLGFNGNDELKTFTLNGCWPVTVGPIQLSAGARDELVTFDVTVRYDYLQYEAGTGSSPAVGSNPGGA